MININFSDMSLSMYESVVENEIASEIFEGFPDKYSSALVSEVESEFL